MNLCDQWYGEWADDTTPQELIDKYKKGIDFILGRPNFPTNTFIKTHIDKELLNSNGIYVDEQHLDIVADGVVILNGKCYGRVEVKEFGYADIYVRHGSIVTIYADSLSRVSVNVLDDADVTVTKDSCAKAFVYQYGGIVHAGEGVIVRDRKDFRFDTPKK